jgi:chaperonin cofactor prefoldin
MSNTEIPVTPTEEHQPEASHDKEKLEEKIKLLTGDVEMKSKEIEGLKEEINKKDDEISG